ncbi:MAG: DUF2147 domain-containing protein [Capnocytophaga sp.]|nr:DUF2147 domain-containing protein [Capnocytophaga sp.]
MKQIVCILVTVICGFFTAEAQSVIGKWKTIDDETGKEKSIVRIYEKDGKVYGQIEEILEKENKGKTCTACSGSNKNKPLEGLVIISGLKKDGNEWSGGKILDPKNGKEYKCYITLESDDKLKLRGYVGISLMGRTQYWYRVK